MTMANQSAAAQTHEIYTGGELAALLELFLKTLNINLEPFDSFQSQIDLSESIGPGVDFHRAITAVKELYRTKPHVVDALHSSVRATLHELEATGLWRCDKFVGPAQVKLLSNAAG
jgi:hypothetical protein